MSQEKVDRYKEEKQNRKKKMKQEKMAGIAWKCGMTAVALALVAWLGYSGYITYQSGRPAEAVEVDYSSIDNFYQSMTEMIQAQNEKPAE